MGVRSARDPEPLIAMGRVLGEITTERRGTQGFGFDPVMYIPELGQTFAEMDPALKTRTATAAAPRCR